MNTALSWIKSFVPGLDCTAQEYTDAMTLTGTKVEGFERLDEDLDKIVVGQVKKIDKHPDADKLVICQVDIGDRQIQIVTGAPNVYEGMKTPVCLDGGRVAGGHDGSRTPGGIKIKKGKLRGIESDGMMCSIEELGSSRDYYPDAPESGLYDMGQDAVVGSDAIEALGLHDVVFEYEITSNRVDCYSIIGIAREAAATFHKDFVLPDIKPTGNNENVNDMISVDVEDGDLCKRYCARMVKNIKLAPSPEWMQRRLAASGIRPINNIVDITNYVMEEYGQPMHAYDYDTIADHKIVVRRAKDKEVFCTLDGQDRTLDSSMLMICDGEKAIGLAGIMGGENSKITDDVKTMLFEAACFDGANIRISAKKAGLRTDASGKFEKGLDPYNAEAAINRACELIEELGAGEVVGGMVDVFPVKPEEKVLPFEPDKYNKLLGTDVSPDEMLKYFDKLEIKYNESDNTLHIPSFRQDLLRTCDMAEEVARFYGYDKIPVTLPSGESTSGKLSFKLRVESVAREVAQFCGFSQSMNYSFESPKAFDKLLVPENSDLRQAIRILNPLGQDFSIMKTQALNGMLTSLATNYNRKNKNVRLYEIGNIYIPKALPLTELPDERTQFTLGMYGDGDFFTMKGVVEEFFEKAGLDGRITYDPEDKKSFLHPGRQADIIYDGVKVGYLGEVHPQVCENYNIGDRVYYADIDMPYIVEHACFDKKYEGIAKFPTSTRDISLVVDKQVLIGTMENAIIKKGGKLLESCELFDIYEGEQVGEGKKSVAFSLVFRAKDRTLSDTEISEIMDKILAELTGLGAVLRQ
ncbi:MAG TPA: phenylalanine--tRNA ligase subunit beta [Lachnospiraceae bacterium]|nr:phenylalanine--tRNA ligase subunit beta [Lachnospiraceae bacterium]